MKKPIIILIIAVFVIMSVFPAVASAATGTSGTAESSKATQIEMQDLEKNTPKRQFTRRAHNYFDKQLNLINSDEMAETSPENSFLYRYQQIIIDMKIAAEKERQEKAEARRIAEETYQLEYERVRLLNARNNIARLSESQMDELFSQEYFTQRLKALGFYKESSGDSSLNMRNAIIRLQSSVNQSINAKLDLVAKKALVEEGAVVATDKTTEPAAEGFWITINKSKNILTVYKGSEIHKKYPVASGKSSSLTPEGKFKLVSKAVNPAWGGAGVSKPVAGGSPSNPLGKRWLGLSIGGGGRYGIHGNAAPRSIGTYASLGCVRMINEDVVELYEYISIGTPVWIGNENKLRDWGVTQGNSDQGVMPMVDLIPEPEPLPEPEPEPVVLVDEYKADRIEDELIPAESEDSNETELAAGEVTAK